MCLCVQMGCLNVGQLIIQSINKLGFKAFESVTTNGKLSAKYDNLRKRSEEGKIIFAFISDYFYRYRFHFFDYRYRFRLGLKIGKNSKTISENQKLSFSFSSLPTLPLSPAAEANQQRYVTEAISPQISNPNFPLVVVQFLLKLVQLMQLCSCNVVGSENQG